MSRLSLPWLASFLCQPPAPNRKISGSSPTFRGSAVLFSDTGFVDSLMLHLWNLCISLARHSAVPPTSASPLNFHFLCKPLSVTADHVCHPLATSHVCPGGAGLIHSGFIQERKPPRKAVHISSLNSAFRGVSWRTPARDGSFVGRGQPTSVSSVALSRLFWKRRQKTDEIPLVMQQLCCSIMRKDPITLLFGSGVKTCYGVAVAKRMSCTKPAPAGFPPQ